MSKSFLINSVIVAVFSIASINSHAQDQINFGEVDINITSCVPYMAGVFEAVEYTLTFPAAITSCVGAADVSIFLANPNTPVVATANSAYSVLVSQMSYSTTTYVAPVQPCSTTGIKCGVVVIFSCYDSVSSTVYIGGNGATCS